MDHDNITSVNKTLKGIYMAIVNTKGNPTRALKELKRMTGGGKPMKKGQNCFKSKTEKMRRAKAAAIKRDSKNFSNMVKNVLNMSHRPVTAKELVEIYK